MKREERQPWNAFPLAALSIRRLHPDISPCAANILQYLATRSNWKGEVWVGQRRIAEDIIRSKAFVTSGVAELLAKGLITTVARGRKNLKADKSVISPSILSHEYRDIVAEATKCNPAVQEDIADEILLSRITSEKCNPDLGECNPAGQDFISECNPAFTKCNPAQQDEALQLGTLQSGSTANLTVGEPKSKEGRNEGRNEEAPFAPLTTPISVSESQTTTDQDTDLYWYVNIADLDYAFDGDGRTIPHEPRHGTEEEIYEVVCLWHTLIGTYDSSPVVLEAIASCLRHHASHEQLLDYMEVMVKQHPKLSKIPWRDLTITEGKNKGKGFLDKFEYNQRQVDAWRRGMAATTAVKQQGLPEYRRKPSGAFSTGADSICCDCGAKGKNAGGKPRCQSCIDKFAAESEVMDIPPVAPAPQPPTPVVSQRVTLSCKQCKGDFEADRSKYWPKNRPFCSGECSKAFDTHQEELLKKYRKEEPVNPLRAFLEEGY